MSEPEFQPLPFRRAVHRGPRLLIADDSADMRWMIRTLLADDFAEVIEAADGRELIWHLIRSSPRPTEDGRPGLVVIADVRMPVYDGLEVLRAWQDGEPRVPLVVITSFPDQEVRDRAAMLGAVFLPKPFSRAELHDAVALAIAQAAART